MYAVDELLDTPDAVKLSEVKWSGVNGLFRMISTSVNIN